MELNGTKDHLASRNETEHKLIPLKVTKTHLVDFKISQFRALEHSFPYSIVLGTQTILEILE
jgi:hypothetical protein